MRSFLLDQRPEKDSPQRLIVSLVAWNERYAVSMRFQDVLTVVEVELCEVCVVVVLVWFLEVV